MISVQVLGEWLELDTLNGYYRLDDIYTQLGNPKGLCPRAFVEAAKPHSVDSIQIRKHVWGSQVKVYQYCAFIDPEFAEILESGELERFKTVATGVTHK